MKKSLKKVSAETLYHITDGQIIPGAPANLSGEVPGLSGDVSGLRGNVTGLSGNLDECGLTDADREAGVNVADLVG